jgi:hypothetical protein
MNKSDYKKLDASFGCRCECGSNEDTRKNLVLCNNTATREYKKDVPQGTPLFLCEVCYNQLGG